MGNTYEKIKTVQKLAASTDTKVPEEMFGVVITHIQITFFKPECKNALRF